MKKEELIVFEENIADLFRQKKIKSPIHLSSNNEDILIRIFKKIKKDDWVFASHRNHYHALLKGIDSNELQHKIINGDSMHICSRKYKFFSSSIVGGQLPIALGIALALKLKQSSDKVWVFVGDMAKEMGTFHECQKFAIRNCLPITFVIEDNGLSVDTPTQEVWGLKKEIPNIINYTYNRVVPHVGLDEWISF